MRSTDFLRAGPCRPARRLRALRGAAAVVATMCFLVTPFAYAADAGAEGASQGAVQVRLTQARVVVEEGKEKLVEVEAVKPGDVIEYRAVYTNTSKQSVRELMASLPVPQGLEYVAKSAKASAGLPAVQVAARDGKYGAEPLMVTEGEKKVPVPLAQYRALRWHVGAMAAGRSVTVSARARVAAPSVVPAAAEAAPQR